MTELISAVRSLAGERVIIAVDGRSASGKTTLAARLAEALDCNVFHMDDFFLRPEQRTPKRLATPGENVDHERFCAEVMAPLLEGKEFSYRPFSCKTQTLGEPVKVTPRRINIVEGAYCCHPSLYDHYDLRVFLDIARETQLERIKKRNPDTAEVFLTRWIPMEEAYFAAYDIKARCDMVKVISDQ